MSSEIPDRLHDYSRFIKLEKKSKAPKVGPDGPFYGATDSELQKWIQSGGNVGLNLGQLVVLDVDHDKFETIANKILPDTFTVRSGGGGEHRYYRSEWSGRRQFSEGGTDIGSVRSGNWYVVVPPSIHDKTENRYTVLHDKPIHPVPEIQIQDFLAEVSEETDSQHSGGRAAAGCVGSSSIPEIPEKYPEKPASWETAKNWLLANDLLKSLNRTSSSDWSGLEFKIAKCLAEGGFSESAISDALSRLHHNSKWHSRDSDYRTRTVRKSIVAACNDSYVSFSNSGDMDDNTSESRKTEESGKGRTLQGGESKMVDFTEKESVLAKESDDEGSTAVKAVKVEGYDPDDDSNFDFVSIRKGSLQERETADGDSALVVDIDDTNGKSVGAVDDLDVVIEALEQLQSEME
jgi:hypothetical protein